jgi:hypothetical protein
MGYCRLLEISRGAGRVIKSYCLVMDNERGITVDFQNLQEDVQFGGEGARHAPSAGSGFLRRGLSDPEAPQVKSSGCGTHVGVVP